MGPTPQIARTREAPLASTSSPISRSSSAASASIALSRRIAESASHARIGSDASPARTRRRAVRNAAPELSAPVSARYPGAKARSSAWSRLRIRVPSATS